MTVSEAISKRRSIRRFRERVIPMEDVEAIISAGILAPSAKNRQPWRFIVVSGEEKAGMLDAMRRGLDKERANEGLFPGASEFVHWADHTARIMAMAPVTVFVMNADESALWIDGTFPQKIWDIANIQSIGAAIENMILAATERGIGSLWICDIFFAYRELVEWLGEEGQMVAAVSFGYAAEDPAARPRAPLADVVKWRPDRSKGNRITYANIAEAGAKSNPRYAAFARGESDRPPDLERHVFIERAWNDVIGI